MKSSKNLSLKTTSIRQLSDTEMQRIAAGDGGPNGNTSLSNAYCGACHGSADCTVGNTGGGNGGNTGGATTGNTTGTPPTADTYLHCATFYTAKGFCY